MAYSLTQKVSFDTDIVENLFKKNMGFIERNLNMYIDGIPTILHNFMALCIQYGYPKLDKTFYNEFIFSLSEFTNNKKHSKKLSDDLTRKCLELRRSLGDESKFDQTYFGVDMSKFKNHDIQLIIFKKIDELRVRLNKWFEDRFSVDEKVTDQILLLISNKGSIKKEDRVVLKKSILEILKLQRADYIRKIDPNYTEPLTTNLDIDEDTLRAVGNAGLSMASEMKNTKYTKILKEHLSMLKSESYQVVKENDNFIILDSKQNKVREIHEKVAPISLQEIVDNGGMTNSETVQKILSYI